MFIEELREFGDRDDVIAVAPDAGASKFVTHFGRALDLKCAVSSKFRPKPEEAIITEIIGDFAGKDKSVHLGFFPAFDDEWMPAELFEEWEQLIPVRERVLKELEVVREAKTISDSLEAHVSLKVPQSQLDVLKKYKKNMPSLFIVSSVEVDMHDEDEVSVTISRAEGEKCQRCWNYSTHVGTSTDYPDFCQRCEDVVREIG